MLAGIVLIAIIIIAAVRSCSNNDSHNEESSTEESSTYVTGLRTEAEESKYQKTNSYNIPCNGNSDMAIEAANVFADKYGGSDHDWNLLSVDASVSGIKGTYRYTYSWAGTCYTATTYFEMTDYGSYRNYTWDGDFVDLFYGN